MREWIKQNRIAIIAILVLTVAGPIAINLLFKQHPSKDFLVAEWDASAALTYYGTIVAAIVAVYGVFLTIQYSQKSYREDVKNRSLPFIVIEVLKAKSHTNLFRFLDTKPENVEDEQEEYYEYKLQDYYCILENGNIIYKTELTKEQQKLLKDGGAKWIQSANGASCVLVDYICMPIEIENIGNGAAIRMRYGINKKNIPEKDRKYLSPMSLKTETPIMLHVFSEDCGEKSANLGEYVLAFYYDDIFSNRYKQEFNINIIYNKEKHAPEVNIDMSHRQEMIGERRDGKDENGVS